MHKNVRSSAKAAKQRAMIGAVLRDGEQVCWEDIACPVTPKGMAFAQRMLRDSLEPIREAFSQYDIVPFSIRRAHTQDFDLEYHEGRNYGKREFTRGGTWWAYRFGFSEDSPPNDVPNVSIIANIAGLDVCLNAEIQPSQAVVWRRIEDSTREFDRLLANHGRLWLKTYLKFEHQPRFYHWILSDFKEPRAFDGAEILRLHRQHEATFPKERERWISEICARHAGLAEPMRRHLEAHTKRLNLAIRLMEPLWQDAPFWSLSLQEKAKEIVATVQRLKPLVDFFVSPRGA